MSEDLTQRPELEGQVGKRVAVQGKGKGFLRFYGKHAKKSGYRCGVQLDTPTGKNSGTIDGHEYFKCPDKCGVLVDPGKVTVLPASEQPVELLSKDEKKQAKAQEAAAKKLAKEKEKAQKAYDKARQAAIKKGKPPPPLPDILKPPTPPPGAKSEEKKKKKASMKKKKEKEQAPPGGDGDGADAPEPAAAAAEPPKPATPKAEPKKLDMAARANSFKASDAPKKAEIQVGKLENKFEAGVVGAAAVEKEEVQVGKMENTFEAKQAEKEAKEAKKKKKASMKKKVGKVKTDFGVDKPVEDKGPQIRPTNEAMRETDQQFAKIVAEEESAKAEQVMVRRKSWVSEAEGVAKPGFVEEIKPTVMSPKPYEPDPEAAAAEQRAIAEANKEKQKADKAQKAAAKAAKKAAKEKEAKEKREAAEKERLRKAAKAAKKNPLLTHAALEAQIGHSADKLAKTGLDTYGRGASKRLHPMLAATQAQPLQHMFVDDE